MRHRKISLSQIYKKAGGGEFGPCHHLELSQVEATNQQQQAVGQTGEQIQKVWRTETQLYQKNQECVEDKDQLRGATVLHHNRQALFLNQNILVFHVIDCACVRVKTFPTNQGQIMKKRCSEK